MVLVKRKTVIFLLKKIVIFYLTQLLNFNNCMKCIAPMKTSGTTKRWNIFFQESICFTSACGIHGNSFVVHAHEVNPVDYPTASIIGAELCDKEIIISFAKMIYQKIKAQETGTAFPLSEKFICSNENAIYINFWSCWIRKTCLLKCLKGLVSENPLAVNVLMSSKNYWNLQKSTFILLFHHSQANWVRLNF